MSDSLDGEQISDDSYLELLELEELESLQEEIQESNATNGDFERLSADLQGRLDSFGIGSMSDLLNRIAAMHAELDEADFSG